MAPSSSTKVPKGKIPAKKGKKEKKAKAVELAGQPETVPSPDEESEQDIREDDEDSDSDNGGVDEEGMERLMKALGDDGLDEFDQAQLNLALGDEEDWEDEDEDEDEDENEAHGSDDEGEDEDENMEAGEGEALSDESKEEDEEEDEAALVALDDEDAGSVEADAVPQQKLELDNEVALARIRESIQLNPSIPWTETLVLSYPQTIDVDVNDDLNRELAFYKQALHGAQEARKLAAQHKFPFSRPSDYFAEMVKSDAHMERIRQRLLDETAGIKKAEEKRKEREGKKFGKQVQIEKLKEREKSKKEMEERLKGLKRKRKDILDNGGEDDAFDIAVEDAISDKRPAKRSRPEGGKKLSRQVRDKKFGFGGTGRRAKQNTKASTDDFDFGSRKGAGGSGKGKGGKGGKGGKTGGSKRPGKSKRMAGRSR